MYISDSVNRASKFFSHKKIKPETKMSKGKICFNILKLTFQTTKEKIIQVSDVQKI